MKPDKLSLDPSSPDAAKHWKHWRRTLENYLDSALGAEQEGRDAAKFRVLINCVDFRVYDYIESCNSYETAITTLANLYVKTPNAFFSRHLLATAKQKPGQTIREF